MQSIALKARQILTSTSLDNVKALRYFGAKHLPFEHVAFTYLFSLSSPGTKDRIFWRKKGICKGIAWLPFQKQKIIFAEELDHEKF